MVCRVVTETKRWEKGGQTIRQEMHVNKLNVLIYDECDGVDAGLLAMSAYGRGVYEIRGMYLAQWDQTLRQPGTAAAAVSGKHGRLHFVETSHRSGMILCCYIQHMRSSAGRLKALRVAQCLAQNLLGSTLAFCILSEIIKRLF